MGLKKIEKHANEMKFHLGHRVRYYTDGHSENFGTILRMNIRWDINGLEIRLEEREGAFPIRIFSDQLRACVTCEAAGRMHY
jgi:hypothetical protein